MPTWHVAGLPQSLSRFLFSSRLAFQIPIRKELLSQADQIFRFVAPVLFSKLHELGNMQVADFQASVGLRFEGEANAVDGDIVSGITPTEPLGKD